MTLREALDVLRESYCRRWTIEYMHVVDRTRKHWLRDRIERRRNERVFDDAARRRILGRLYHAQNFEQFLHKRYVGNKRFSLEGAEALIPALAELIERAGAAGVEKVVIGMAHRGRLNVLTNILAKSYAQVFREFEGVLLPLSTEGSGDVKYHLGARGRFTTADGREIEVVLAANPSHLEAVDPAVCGLVRGYQDELEDADRRRVLGVLVHGDAAFAGQGVVAETFQMSNLPAFRTGGTVHVVVNNQIGFTAGPKDTRSTYYCTDIAKSIQAPILHANGNNPEAVLRSVHVAVDYQREFGLDVVVDLVCYRRWGHNEGDEPAFTQPVLYRHVRGHPTVVDHYRDLLVRSKSMTREACDEVGREVDAALKRAVGELGDSTAAADLPLEEVIDVRDDDGADFSSGEGPPTGVAAPELESLVACLNSLPEGHVAHPNLVRQLSRRERMVRGEQGIDWGCAEALAFATILSEGTPVRIVGQDSGRGTFSHRHAVIRHQETGEDYVPLDDIGGAAARFEVRDSLLVRRGGARLRVGLLHRATERARPVGGPVRRLRQRRADRHRPVHRRERGQVARDERSRDAPAARLRRPGSRALERAARALLDALLARQPDRRQLHDVGAVLPPAAAARSYDAAAPADRDDAEVAVARPPRGERRRGAGGAQGEVRARHRRGHPVPGGDAVRRAGQLLRASCGQGPRRNQVHDEREQGPHRLCGPRAVHPVPVARCPRRRLRRSAGPTRPDRPPATGGFAPQRARAGLRSGQSVARPIGGPVMAPDRAAGRITVVSPVYNEGDNVVELVVQLQRAFEGSRHPLSILLVDDGSEAPTAELLDELARTRSGVRVLHLSRNFGHQAALTAGLDAAEGDAVVTMDSDLQHPVEVVPELVQRWEEGADVVHTVRHGQQEGWFKRITSPLYYRLMRAASPTPVIPGAADFRLFDRRVVEVLRNMTERARYLRGMSTWVGFRSATVPFRVARRRAGATKYTLRKMIRLGLDGLVSLSSWPLYASFYLGIGVTFASVAYLLYVLHVALVVQATVPGWSSIMVTLLLLTGMQTTLMGVIGLYLGRVYDEVRGRPTYIVARDTGLDR